MSTLARIRRRRISKKRRVEVSRLDNAVVFLKMRRNIKCRTCELDTRDSFSHVLEVGWSIYLPDAQKIHPSQVRAHCPTCTKNLESNPAGGN